MESPCDSWEYGHLGVCPGTNLQRLPTVSPHRCREASLKARETFSSNTSHWIQYLRGGERDLHKEFLLKRTVTVDVSEEGSPHKNQTEGGFGCYGTPGVGIWQTDPKRILWRDFEENTHASDHWNSLLRPLITLKHFQPAGQNK